MKNDNYLQARQAQDQFGLRVAARLSQSTAELPHDITERLRAARLQALDARRTASLRVPAMALAGHSSLSPSGDDRMNLWGRIASALPLIILVAGLFAVYTIQNDRRAREVAEVDAALLTDDLPPSAYADPGFIQFLKSGRE